MRKAIPRAKPAAPSGASDGVALVAVRGPKAALSKVQQEFNRLTGQIGRARARLGDWETYAERHSQRVHADLLPALAALRDAQRRLAQRIDALLGQRETGLRLNRRDRSKLSALIATIVQAIIGDGPEFDPELEALHDKHSAISNQELRRRDLQHAEAMAASVLGDDAVAGHAAKSVDELLRHVHDQAALRAEAEQREDDARRAAQAARRGRPTRAERDAERRVQSQKEAGASLREIYRKLASTLHPDRESDLAERERKTLLMQRVNQAYAADDLLGLLNLQLEIEQIDADHLATVPEARMKHYNEILRGQEWALQQELMQFELRFADEIGSGYRLRDPSAAATAFAKQLAEVKSLRRNIETDLVQLDDPRRRRALVERLIDADDDFDDFEPPDPRGFDAIFDLPLARGGRAGRR